MNSKRRLFSKAGLVALQALVGGTGLLRPILSSASDEKWNKGAFGAKTIEEAARALGNVESSDNISVELDVPEIVENGAAVPVAMVGRSGESPATTGEARAAIALAVTSNPTPLVAYFSLGKGVDVFIRTRIRMRETSSVVGIIAKDGEYNKKEQPVKVVLGGCEASVALESGNKRPLEPMRIKAVAREKALEISILVPHDMAPGLASAGTGAKRNARFIDRVFVSVLRAGKEEPVLIAQLSPGVSKNPFLNFRVSSRKDVTSVIVKAWDNANLTRCDEFVLPSPA